MKTIAKLFGFTALAAVIVLSMTTCGTDPGDTPIDEIINNSNGWVNTSQGNTYKPINIPKVQWLGDRRELGANSNFWNINIVTTVRDSNGSFTYSLKDYDTGEDAGYNVFDVLHILSMEPGDVGTGPLPLGHENSSVQINSVPGILFMWDRNEEIRDNFYQKQFDSTLDEFDNYYPGILKIHEAVFQRYIAVLLRVKFTDDSYKEYLVMPQRGQLRNVGENGREGDSYIFYIDEISGQFSSNPITNYITNVWVERYVATETPKDPPVQPPEPPPPPYTITYIAVDEEGNSFGADGIFDGTGGEDLPVSVEKNGSFSFVVEAPENYILISVKAGTQTLTGSGNQYSYTPTDDVTITAAFEYDPPPMPPPPYTITYEAISDSGNPIVPSNGIFTGVDNPVAPWHVTQGDAVSFKVVKPTDDVFVVELIEVRAGETVLTETGGVYSFTPGGDVTVTAVIKIGLPPVDDYHPTEEDDPYGTAVIVTPPEKTGNKFVIISTASAGGAEVDTNNTWLFGGKPIKNYWTDAIKAKSKTNYNNMIKIKNSAGKTATWIWDRQDSWAYGVSGCFTVITASRFYIDEGEEVVESTIPFYFACDNACAVYVNGHLAGYTTVPFADYKKNSKDKTMTVRDKPGPTSDWRFTGLSNDDFSGDDLAWNTLYMVNIKPWLIDGHNEILIMAANNDDSGGRWNTTNNPAGLLFACEFSVRPK